MAPAPPPNPRPDGEVWAIVVTHNRRELLCESLAALDRQSRPLDRTLVVDNASSDGTPEMLRAECSKLDLLALPTNEGGAGGFHEGMKRAYLAGAQWLWLMDDDTIPRPDALAELLAGAERAAPLRPRSSVERAGRPRCSRPAASPGFHHCLRCRRRACDRAGVTGSRGPRATRTTSPACCA